MDAKMNLKLSSWFALVFLAAVSVISDARRNSIRNRLKGRLDQITNFKKIPGQCHKRTTVMTKTYGTIRSPGYPYSYGNKQRCTWQISVPKGFRIRLKFRRQFGIESSPGCVNDYIMVGQSKGFKNPLKFCGKNRPSSIFSPKNTLWIRMRTDNSRTDKGFLASYQAIDENECEKQVCTFPSLCRNTVGSYACDCPDGFENRGGRSMTKCVDTDECQSGEARCEHSCVNTDGSYYCKCRSGFHLAPDGRRCRADVNECQINNGGCSHFCSNARSSYRCLCPKDFTLHTDKKSCFPEIKFERDQYMASVKENSQPGTLIMTIKAKPFNQKLARPLQYKLLSENLKPPTRFSIDSHSGTIRVLGKLDREKTASYLLEVSATFYHGNGSLGLAVKTYVIVNILDVNDHVPRFEETPISVRVPCNFTVGKILHRMTAKDKDSGSNAKIKFRFSTKNAFFSILPNTGKIRLRKSLKRFCNISPGKRFKLTVNARDNGQVPNMAMAIVQVEVTPPGMSRTVSVMHARLFDAVPKKTDKVARRQAKGPHKN